MALLADLPNVRAMMTTHDAATIQDASRDLWHLAGSDLMMLADASGRVVALQAAPPEITMREGQEFFPPSVSRKKRGIGGTWKAISMKSFCRTFILVR